MQPGEVMWASGCAKGGRQASAIKFRMLGTIASEGISVARCVGCRAPPPPLEWVIGKASRPFREARAETTKRTRRNKFWRSRHLPLPGPVAQAHRLQSKC